MEGLELRKRLALLWTPLVLPMALALPASTTAANLGSIGFVDGYCSGNNAVNATFKLTKKSGFYATKLTMTAKGRAWSTTRGATSTTSARGPSGSTPASRQISAATSGSTRATLASTGSMSSARFGTAARCSQLATP
jgi:hypothetical protein